MIRSSPLSRPGLSRSPMPARTKWMKRLGKRGHRSMAELRKARPVVLQTAGYVCAIKVPGICEGEATEVHHLKLRSQGGTNEVSNLAAVCTACHRYAHSHPAESYANGFLIPRTA